MKHASLSLRAASATKKFFIFGLAAVLSSCSHGAGLKSIPSTPGAVAAAAITQPNLFAATQNKVLSDSDIQRYIDPSVMGPDRSLALKLMRAMASGLRGDFIAMDRNGRTFSNNPALLGFVKVTTGLRRRPIAPPVSGPRKPLLRHTMDYSSNCAPPPSQGGEDVRDVSACGMTDGWGFVYLPCGTTYFAPGDDGFLYMEITGSGGATNGTTIEGGYQVNPPPGGGPGDGTIQAYTRASYLNNDQYLQMNYSNPSYTFSCGQTLVITHGVSAAANDYVYTMVGQLPSSIDPQTQYVNMNSQFF